MKKILNPKILIPAVVLLLLLGSVGYIFLAPSTWWKPIYIRVEGDATPTPEGVAQDTAPADPAAQQPSVPTAPQQPVASAQQPAANTGTPGTMPQPVGVSNTTPMLGYMQADQPGPGIMYNLDTMVVNLAEPGGLRYLQTTIVLEFWPLIENYYGLTPEERTLAEDTFKGKIDTLRPMIDDAIMTILSSKKYNDISSIDGKQALKQEIINAMNGILGYQGVTNVYFTDFLVQ